MKRNFGTKFTNCSSFKVSRVRGGSSGNSRVWETIQKQRFTPLYEYGWGAKKLETSLDGIVNRFALHSLWVVAFIHLTASWKIETVAKIVAVIVVVVAVVVAVAVVVVTIAVVKLVLPVLLGLVELLKSNLWPSRQVCGRLSVNAAELKVAPNGRCSASLSSLSSLYCLSCSSY